MTVPGERVEDWAARIGLCYPSGQPVPPGAVPLARALRTAQALDPEEYAIHTAGGERRLIELTATPVLSAAPPGPDFPEDAVLVAGAVAVFRDVTDLRHSQQQERAANRRVETLVGISRRLNATLDLDEIHAIVTEGALTLLPERPRPARPAVRLRRRDQDPAPAGDAAGRPPGPAPGLPARQPALHAAV